MSDKGKIERQLGVVQRDKDEGVQKGSYDHGSRRESDTSEAKPSPMPRKDS